MASKEAPVDDRMETKKTVSMLEDGEKSLSEALITMTNLDRRSTLNRILGDLKSLIREEEMKESDNTTRPTGTETIKKIEMIAPSTFAPFAGMTTSTSIPGGSGNRGIGGSRNMGIVENRGGSKSKNKFDMQRTNITVVLSHPALLLDKDDDRNGRLFLGFFILLLLINSVIVIIMTLLFIMK